MSPEPLGVEALGQPSSSSNAAWLRSGGPPELENSGFAGPPARSAWLAAMLGAARAHRGLSLQGERLRRFLQGFGWRALSADEHAALCVGLYGKRSRYGPPGLFEWERIWFRSQLPGPPARVLVGGAGSGRELRWLQSQGYQVYGCEPNPALVAGARRSLPGVKLWELRYEQWCSAAPPGGPARYAPYDAVIFGWGSFGHTLSGGARHQVLQRSVQWCPTGPLLLSGLMGCSPSRQPRSERLGERVGTAVARLRKLSVSPGRPPEFYSHAGYVHRFSAEELRGLASELGRRLERHSGPYGHVTFRLV